MLQNADVMGLLRSLSIEPYLPGKDPLSVAQRRYELIRSSIETNFFGRGDGVSAHSQNVMRRLLDVVQIIAIRYDYGHALAKDGVQVEEVARVLRSLGVLDSYLNVLALPHDFGGPGVLVHIKSSFYMLMRYFLLQLNTYYLGNLTRAGIVTKARPPVAATVLPGSSLFVLPAATTTTSTSVAIPPPSSSSSSSLSAAAATSTSRPQLAAAKSSDPSPPGSFALTQPIIAPVFDDDIDSAWRNDDNTEDEWRTGKPMFGDMMPDLLHNKVFIR
jgi:hypothetical protein